MDYNRLRRHPDGRFAGTRYDVEQVPRLPTFPARWVLTDPRRRPYLVIWTSDDGGVRHGLKMAAAESDDAVLVTLENSETYRIWVLSRPLPSGHGMALFYRCLWCGKPRRYLYRLTLVGKELVSYLGLRCQACAGLRWSSQGRYRTEFEKALLLGLPRPRYPWDPRAVSDPRLLSDQPETPDDPRPPE